MELFDNLEDFYKFKSVSEGSAKRSGSYNKPDNDYWDSETEFDVYDDVDMDDSNNDDTDVDDDYGYDEDELDSVDW